jgi:hypothetical protein
MSPKFLKLLLGKYMVISQDSVVTLNYELTDSDGNIIGRSRFQNVFIFTAGMLFFPLVERPVRPPETSIRTKPSKGKSPTESEVVFGSNRGTANGLKMTDKWRSVAQLPKLAIADGSGCD